MARLLYNADLPTSTESATTTFIDNVAVLAMESDSATDCFTETANRP
jgi:hypothetical protein